MPPRRRGRFLRLGLPLLAGLVVLAILIPYFIPERKLCQMVAQNLHDQTGAEATVGHVQFGWLSGLQLKGLTLIVPATDSRIQIAHLRIPPELLRLITGRPLTRLDLNGITVSLDRQKPLPAFSGHGGAPQVFPANRVQVSNLAIDLRWPDGYRNLIQVPSLYMQVEKPTLNFTGKVLLQYMTRPDSPAVTAGRMSLRGGMRIVRQDNQQCFAGTVTADWRNLDLASLRIPDLPGTDLIRLRGINGGSLNVELFPDLHFKWQLRTEFRDLEVQRRQAPAPGRLRALSVITRGSHDPVTGNLDLQQLDLESKAFSLHSRLAARIDETGLIPSQVDLTGRFDSPAVPQWLPAVQDCLGPQATINGPGRFDLHWSGKAPAYNMTAALDVGAVEIAHSDILDKTAGLPLALALSLRSDPAHWPWITLDNLTFNFGDLNVQGKGQLPGLRPADDLAAWLDGVRRLGQVELVVHAPRVETLGDRIKPLKPIFADVGFAGPATLRVDYAGQSNGGQTNLTLELDPTTSLACRDFFVKPAGQAMRLVLQNAWPWRPQQPQVSSSFLFQCGPAQLSSHEQPARLTWAFSKPDGRIRLDTVGDFACEARALDALVALSPRLQRDRWPDRFAGAAEVKASTALQLLLTDEGWTVHQARLHAEVQADQTSIDFPDLYRKAAHVPLLASLDYRVNPSHQRHEFDGVLKWQQVSSRLRWTHSFAGAPEEKITGRYDLQIGDLDETLLAFPGLIRQLDKRVALDGKLTLAADWSSSAAGQSLHWQVDGADAAAVVAGRELKLPGMPATVMGTLTLPPADDAAHRSFTIAALEARLGDNFLRLAKGAPGTVRLRGTPGGDWRQNILGVEPWLAWRTSALESIALNLDGRLEPGGTLTTAWPAFAQWVRQYGLTGATDFNLRAQMNHGRWETRFLVQLDRLGVLYRNLIAKAPGIPAVLEIAAAVWPSPTDPRSYQCLFDNLTFRLGPLELQGRAEAQIARNPAGQPDLHKGRLSAKLKPLDLAELSEVSGLAARLHATGKVAADLTVDHDGRGLQLGPSQLRFDQAAADFSHRTIALDGAILLSQDYCRSDGLDLTAGGSSLHADWRTLLTGGGITGTVELTTPFLDLDQLQQTLNAAWKEFASAAPSPLATLPATQPTPAQEQERMRQFQPWRAMAEKSNLLVSLQARALDATDPRSGVRHPLRNLVGQCDLGKDPTTGRPHGDLKFWSRVAAGGQVRGDFFADLTQENPTLVLASDIDNLKMSAPINPLVEDFFPGLHVTGRISITEDNTTVRMFAPPGVAPNYPVGTGRMVFVDGYMVGRAAPDWVVRIFPGLNFTEYSFDRMHNWFTKQANGVVHNNMIFLGYPWNVYMEGDSKPGGLVEYEVGVDLMARYESEYWSSVGQGRIPIFHTSGRIVHGTMTEQKVTYVLPHELAYRVLVKNNAITGAYRLLMRQLHKAPPKEPLTP